MSISPNSSVIYPYSDRTGITQKMSSEQRISIKIHPGPNRKKLISLLLTNKFQKEDVDYVLYPEDQE